MRVAGAAAGRENQRRYRRAYQIEVAEAADDRPSHGPAGPRGVKSKRAARQRKSAAKRPAGSGP